MGQIYWAHVAYGLHNYILYSLTYLAMFASLFKVFLWHGNLIKGIELFQMVLFKWNWLLVKLSTRRCHYPCLQSSIGDFSTFEGKFDSSMINSNKKKKKLTSTRGFVHCCSMIKYFQKIATWWFNNAEDCGSLWQTKRHCKEYDLLLNSGSSFLGYHISWVISFFGEISNKQWRWKTIPLQTFLFMSKSLKSLVDELIIVTSSWCPN